eukprot:jgi/Ulvmu1/166/UM001_0170.1
MQTALGLEALCCPISQEPFQDDGPQRPCMLPCGHTISLASLQLMLAPDVSHACPFCRMELPHADSHKYPVNYAILGLLASGQPSHRSGAASPSSGAPIGPEPVMATPSGPSRNAHATQDATDSTPANETPAPVSPAGGSPSSHQARSQRLLLVPQCTGDAAEQAVPGELEPEGPATSLAVDLEPGAEAATAAALRGKGIGGVFDTLPPEVRYALAMLTIITPVMVLVAGIIVWFALT